MTSIEAYNDALKQLQCLKQAMCTSRDILQKQIDVHESKDCEQFKLALTFYKLDVEICENVETYLNSAISLEQLKEKR